MIDNKRLVFAELEPAKQGPVKQSPVKQSPVKQKPGCHGNSARERIIG